MKKFTADFETATWNPNKTWVWAWATCEIETSKINLGNTIESFIEYARSQKNSIFYFHNLKFDGEFIISWALNNGFTHAETKEEIKDMTFTTLISDVGLFYSIVLYFKKGNKKCEKITFYDSLKIIPFSVDEIAKAFNLPISKLKIDYKEERKKSHILTEEEKDYIKNDVLIVAKALKTIFDSGLTKMTEGSNAIYDYKKILTESKFLHYFPPLEYEIDADLRKSYKGGFTYLNPIYKEKDVGKGVVLDVNSLYPSVMYEKLLPFRRASFL